jgi:hypothetical protein
MPLLRFACLAVLVSSLAAAGCSSDGPAPTAMASDAGHADASGHPPIADARTWTRGDACPGAGQGDLPCDVAGVLEICRNCHQNPPVRGAPFPFLTYEDTQAVYFGATLRWQRMAQVIEPDEPLHMPPRAATDVPQLTDLQLQLLRNWFAACTPPEPESQGCDKGEAP